MRLVLQRVRSASVTVDKELVCRVGRGMLVLVGVERGDDETTVAAAVAKLAHLRIFEDAAGMMNRAIDEIDGEFLIVSQFTLAASTDKGRRPSFERAAAPEVAAPLVDGLTVGLRARGLKVATGRFAAVMQVELVNDGPATFVIDL